MASSVKHFRNSRIDRKLVILVVEDEIVLRSLIATYLRDSDFRVIEAANAEEAIAIINSQTAVNFVFTDINMPGKMNGVGLAHWLQENHRDIPVLVTTGARERLTISEKIPAEQFVPKPYIFGDIEDRIRKFLQEP